MKNLLLFSVVLAFCLITPRLGVAQSLTGFDKSTTMIGPHVGLAAFGSAPAFGLNFETAVTEPGKMGPGILGISGRVDYFSYSYGLFDLSASYTWITAGVFANYHFAMDNKSWDPFLGLGLGYQNVSVSWNNSTLNGLTPSWGSGVYFSGNAGIRYFFSPGMAARAQAGFGVTWLVVGLDFKL